MHLLKYPMARLLLNVLDYGDIHIVKRDLCLPDKSDITQEILAYLIEHPEAGDTFEGIMQWWMLDRKIRYHQKKVKEAISDLISKEFIIEQSRQDSRKLYFLNKNKDKEIQDFLKGNAKS